MQKARNQEYTADLQRLSGKLAELGYYHSIELPDGSVIPGFQSARETALAPRAISDSPGPARQTGARYRRLGRLVQLRNGAPRREVVAVDATPQDALPRSQAMLNSKVEHVSHDICRLTPRRDRILRYRPVPRRSLSPEASHAGARKSLRALDRPRLRRIVCHR